MLAGLLGSVSLKICPKISRQAPLAHFNTFHTNHSADFVVASGPHIDRMRMGDTLPMTAACESQLMFL
jgi:hypothetical protein